MAKIEMSDGVWYLSWSGGSAYVLADSGGTDEMWASDAGGFLPLSASYTAQKTTQDFSNVPDFLAWVCTQYSGSQLYVVHQESTFTPYNGGTYSCSQQASAPKH